MKCNDYDKFRDKTFGLDNYCKLLVVDESDELIVSIEDNSNYPIIVKDGYKVILNPKDITKNLEEYF